MDGCLMDDPCGIWKMPMIEKLVTQPRQLPETSICRNLGSSLTLLHKHLCRSAEVEVSVTRLQPRLLSKSSLKLVLLQNYSIIRIFRWSIIQHPHSCLVGVYLIVCWLSFRIKAWNHKCMINFRLAQSIWVFVICDITSSHCTFEQSEVYVEPVIISILSNFAQLSSAVFVCCTCCN